MKIVSTPAFPWLTKDFHCPDCGVVVRFELSDLTSLPKIAVRQEQGKWIVRRPCVVCGPVKHFEQVPDAPLVTTSHTTREENSDGND